MPKGIISEPIKKLLANYGEPNQLDNVSDDTPKIRVSATVSTLAFLYEKIRNAVDIKEDHLLRKNAIRRFLARRLVARATGSQIAKPLIQEMIRARYLSNNKIPESAALDLAETVDKYIYLMNVVADNNSSGVIQEGLFDWAIDLASCEIEEQLSSNEKKEALAQSMYEVIHDDITFQGEEITDEERDIQVFIAIHRAVAKSDDAMIAYRVFRLYYPNWHSPTKEQVDEVGLYMETIKGTIDVQVFHPVSMRLQRRLKKSTVLFHTLRDLIEANPDEAEVILANPDRLAIEVEKAANRKYKAAKSKLTGSIIRAIFYILLTKSILAFLIELPYDLYVVGEVSYRALVTNIVFHPFFLAVAGLLIKAPGKNNTQKIVEGVKGIVYEAKEIGLSSEIKRPKVVHSTTAKIFFGLFYFVMFLLSFGILVSALTWLEFNMAGIFFFLFFLTIVSYFAVRVRRNIRELNVMERRDSIFSVIIDFFAIPILSVGHWISVKFSKINIFVFLMDFIIEAPFKVLIEIVEEWIGFVREKKDEIQEDL
ncbi:MAG: hypothetical protein ABIE68_00355 [bacterium]